MHRVWVASFADIYQLGISEDNVELLPLYHVPCVTLGGSGIKKGGGGWQRHIAAVCDVWLSSGSRRSLLLRRYRSRRRVGHHFPCEVFLASEGRTISKKTAFLFFCSFFLTSSGSDKNLPTHFRGKKICRTKSNGPVSRWFFSCSFGQARVGGRHQLPVFPGLILQKGKREVRSQWLFHAELFFPCPLVVKFNVSVCIHAHEYCWTLCSVHRPSWPNMVNFNITSGFFLGFFRTVKRGEVRSAAEIILLLSSDSIFECIHGCPSS